MDQLIHYYKLYKIAKNKHDNKSAKVLAAKIGERCIIISLKNKVNLYQTPYHSDDDMINKVDLYDNNNRTIDCKSIDARNERFRNFSGPAIVNTDYLIFYKYINIDTNNNIIELPDYFYLISKNEYIDMLKHSKDIRRYIDYNIIPFHCIENRAKRFDFCENIDLNHFLLG